MKRRWNRNRSFGVEYELEAGRPKPSDALVRAIEGRIQRRHVRVAGNLRFALAAGLTVALVVPFVAFGALGDAPSAVSNAVKNVARVVHLAAPAHQAPAPTSNSSQSVVVTNGAQAGDDPSPAGNQYKNHCKQEAKAKYEAALAAAKAQFKAAKRACHGVHHCIADAKYHYQLAQQAALDQYNQDLHDCKKQ